MNERHRRQHRRVEAEIIQGIKDLEEADLDEAEVFDEFTDSIMESLPPGIRVKIHSDGTRMFEIEDTDECESKPPSDEAEADR